MPLRPLVVIGPAGHAHHVSLRLRAGTTDCHGSGSPRAGPGAGGQLSPCSWLSVTGSNASEHELMQYRLPVGLGPSLKTWPRWPPQRRHTTSVRRMSRPLSGRNSTASATSGWSELGQAVPELNLASELNNLAPQPAHR